MYTPKGKRVAQTSQYPPGWHPTAAVATKPKSEKPKTQPSDKSKPPPSEKPKPQQVEKIKTKDKKAEAAKAKAITVSDVSEKLQDATISPATDPTIEISKKLKRLRKRLRESEQLEEKCKTGDVTNPDQLEKIARRKEFEEEIEQLEAERLKLRDFRELKT